METRAGDPGAFAQFDLSRVDSPAFVVDAAKLRVSDAERTAAAATVPAAQREALIFAARRIEAFHRALLPKDVDFTDATGTPPHPTGSTRRCCSG